jgi:transcriptional regulator GlxA family with amidase domain
MRYHTGLAPRDYLHNERIGAASRLLMTTELSLTRIAHLAGFADHSHFTREFVRHDGHSPSVHRRHGPSHVASVQAAAIPGVHFGTVVVRLQGLKDRR